MSMDPGHQAAREELEAMADQRVVEAMLNSISPSEIEAQDQRILEALDAISAGDDSPALRMSVESVGGQRSMSSRRWWPALGGLGAGLAAMLAVTFILLARPGEAQASAAIWFARAEAAASDVAEVVRGYLIEITPHESAPDPRRLGGRLALQEVEGSGPLVRLDIDEPEDRRHSIGVDAIGGWHRRTDDSLREFPGRSISERFVIPGLDLLLDPLPGFYQRVQRHYEVVEIVESPQPRLVARHRDQAERNPRVPDRIEIVLDPDDWSLEAMVLGWDEPIRASRQPGRRPGPAGPGVGHERGRQGHPPGPPKGPTPGAKPPPGSRSSGPPPHARPGPHPGRGAPPPPAEIRITRIVDQPSFSVDR